MGLAGTAGGIVQPGGVFADRPRAAGFARVLGVDVGARRLGVACGSRVTGSAQPVGVVERRDGEFDWPALDRLQREWRPEALVVGLPLTLDGGEQDAAKLAREFAAAASARYGLPVALQDERHSSLEAAARFAQARREGKQRRKGAAALDAVAAVIIVERYFLQTAQSDYQTMALPPVDALLDTLTGRLRAHLDARGIDQPRFAGIRTGGVWIAEAIASRCGASGAGGVVDIGFHRDDVGRRGILPRLGPSSIPWDLNDRDIVLIDDVMRTGRTARAALNALFDWGRPRSVTLAVLAELPARELPVQPDVVGGSFEPRVGCELRLKGPVPLELSWEKEQGT